VARIRTIKPGLFHNEKLSALPLDAHWFSVALLPHVDDEGYFNANPALLKAHCAPLRNDITPQVVDRILGELDAIGYTRRGQCVADGRTYGQVVGFSRHQVINKKKPSAIKCLEIAWERCGNSAVAVPESYNTEVEVEGNGMEELPSSPQAAMGDVDSKHEQPKPDTQPAKYHDDFNVFWKEYPRKIGKDAAFTAWKKAKHKPGLPEILAAIQRARGSPKWLKDGGEYIPNPATWLNQGRWADEVGAQSATSGYQKFT